MYVVRPCLFLVLWHSAHSVPACLPLSFQPVRSWLKPFSPPVCDFQPMMLKPRPLCSAWQVLQSLLFTPEVAWKPLPALIRPCRSLWSWHDRHFVFETSFVPLM